MTTEDPKDQKDSKLEPRLPYAAPELVRLGTVRELTGGSTGSASETYTRRPKTGH